MKSVLKYISLLLVALFVTMGCVADRNLGIDGERNPMEVRLWADMGYSPNLVYSPQSTRGGENSTSGIIDAATDTIITMGMARIDENHTPSYPAFLNCGEPIIAEMGAPDPNNSYIRKIEFTSAAQFFYNALDYVKYVAWQPWRPDEEGYEYSSDGAATTVRIPITGDSDILYGNVTSGSLTDGFNVMEFGHALCVYRIYIYTMQEEDGTQSSAWGLLEDMQIEDLPSSCVMTLPKDEKGTFTIDYQGSETIVLSDPNNNIFFSPGDKIPVGLANRRMVSKCIAAPPADGILDISLATTTATTRQRVSIARNFKPGYAYDIVLRFSNHGLINADVSVGEWIRHEEVIEKDFEVDMFYNLSTYETANSYIVGSANNGYCFDGTVKGNGDNSLLNGVDTKLNPGYIDILWDDTPLVTIDGVQRKALTVRHELTEGRVMFEVQGNPADIEDKRLLSEGNVLIAAYDEEGGEILWTWHIWLTNRVSAQGYPQGYIVQDRNLGAISDVPDGANGMDGLYYQWGRPTPFKPASSGAYGAVSKVPSSSAQVASVEEAMRQPTTLLGAGAASGDWLSTTNDALWGYQNEYTDLEKTLYDPCPPGYMVADMRVWMNMDLYEKSGGWQSGTGVNLSIASNNVWYPFQGHIESDGTEDINRESLRMWSSVIDTKFGGTNNPYELRYSASGDSSWSSADSERNRALPVRCVSNHSTAIVTDLSASQTANSYMIHRSGYYKFKTTVRGNGVGSLLPLGGTTTAEINGGLATTIHPAKIDFLWWQGDFTEVTGDASDIDNLIPLQILDNGEPDENGYITMYVGEFHKGNIGLAAYDVDGEILWSWHLWFTDKPASVITGNYTFMDRYLGATSAPDVSGASISFADEKARMATYGFYYQWGRKDPIMGPPSAKAGNESVSGNPRSSQYWVKDYVSGNWTSRTDIDVAAAATIPVITQNPMTFYMSTSTSGNNTSGWFPSTFADGYTNVALWGYAVEDYSIQGQTFSKTMHDPCPPGYRTPFHHAWGYGNDQGYSYGENGGNINLSNGEADYDNYGLVLGKAYFDKAWYPFVGYRYPTTGAYTGVGTNGHLLTGMPMGQYNTRSYVYTNTYTGQVANSGGSGYGSAYAMPARCQKE